MPSLFPSPRPLCVGRCRNSGFGTAVPHDLVVSRTIDESGSALLTITLNGESMLALEDVPEITSLGLRPWRSTIHLEQFSID
jgi:hypothetical protein